MENKRLNSQDETMRISKFLAYCGIASRRKAKNLILEKKVKVNGKIITDLSYQVNIEKDIIEVNNKKIIPPPKVYYIFYKPRGYLTSLYDPYNRPTIAQFLKKLPYKVFPVGRLDKDSEGLLFLTNDGDVAYKLLHPKFEVKRTYLVWVKPDIDKNKLKKLITQGIFIEEKLVKPLVFTKLETKKNQIYIYKVVLKEGVKREIRKMVAYLGSNVLRLIRIRFGPLKLKNLKPGEIKELSKEEKEKLFEFINTLNQNFKK